MAFGIDDIIATGLKIIDKVIPNPAEKEAAKLELLRLQQAGEFKQIDTIAASDASQSEVNKVEAGNSNLFVSGWRPATGWCCVGGLGYQIMLRPMLGWIMANIFHWSMPPDLNIDTLMTLLFGLLGLGGYRTFEKVKGVANK